MLKSKLCKASVLFSALMFVGCGSSDDGGAEPPKTDLTLSVPSNVSVAENAGLNISAKALGNGAETVTFSLGESGDNEYFLINDVSGAISLQSAFNYENPIDQNLDNTYHIEVVATSANGKVASAELSVAVTDVQEYDINVVFPPTNANLALLSDSVAVRGNFTKLVATSDAKVYVNGVLAEFIPEDMGTWRANVDVLRGQNVLTVDVVTDGVTEVSQQYLLDNYPIPHRSQVTYVDGVEYGISLANDVIYRRTEKGNISALVVAKELGDRGVCISFDDLQYISAINTLYFNCRIADVGSMEHFEYSLDTQKVAQLNINARSVLSSDHYLVSVYAFQDMAQLLIYDALARKTGTVNLQFNGESLAVSDSAILVTDHYIYVLAADSFHSFRFSIDSVLSEGGVIDTSVEVEVADEAKPALLSGMSKLGSRYYGINDGRIQWFDADVMAMRDVPFSEQLINEAAKPSAGNYRYLYELAPSPLGRDYISLVSFVDEEVFDIHVESGETTASYFDSDLRYRSLGMLEKLDQEGTLITYNYVTATFETVDLKAREIKDIYSLDYDRSTAPKYFSEISADPTQGQVYLAPNYGWGGTTDLSLSALMAFDSIAQELNSILTIAQMIDALGIDKDDLKVRVLSAEYVPFENMVYLAISYSRLSSDEVNYGPSQAEIIKFNPLNNTFTNFYNDDADGFSELKATFVEGLNAVAISGYGYSSIRLTNSGGGSEVYTPERQFRIINYPVVGATNDDLFFSGFLDYPVPEYEMCEFGRISVLGGDYKVLAKSPLNDTGLCFFNSTYSKEERIFYGSGGRGLQALDELSGSRVFLPLKTH